MNPFQIHATELITGLQAEMGEDCYVVTFTNIQGSFKIIPGTAAYNKPLRDGGFSQMFDFTFSVTVNQFVPGVSATAGALKDALMNQPIFYLDVPYKVAFVNLGAGGCQAHIGCNSVNQNV